MKILIIIRTLIIQTHNKVKHYFMRIVVQQFVPDEFN